jgi:hypothetical protein
MTTGEDAARGHWPIKTRLYYTPLILGVFSSFPTSVVADCALTSNQILSAQEET